jgi:hypothetical protein
MTDKEILLDCLNYYEIAVIAERNNIIETIKGYSIEVESNGLYKLMADSSVVAPFKNLDELCNFILNY